MRVVVQPCVLLPSFPVGAVVPLVPLLGVPVPSLGARFQLVVQLGQPVDVLGQLFVVLVLVLTLICHIGDFQRKHAVSGYEKSTFTPGLTDQG